jgi:hypothetical protein
MPSQEPALAGTPTSKSDFKAERATLSLQQHQLMDQSSLEDSIPEIVTLK